MISFRLRMEFEPKACDDAAGVLRSLVGPVRAESGCSATRLLRDLDDSCAVSYVEEWRSLEDLQKHPLSESRRVVDGDAAARRRSAESEQKWRKTNEKSQ